MASLQADNLGKAYGQQLLSMEISIPADWQTEFRDSYLDNPNSRTLLNHDLKNFQTDSIKFEISQNKNLAMITLNRPKERNTINNSVIESLDRCCEILTNNKNRIRAVVLKAEGKHFCTGGDPKEFLLQVKNKNVENNENNNQNEMKFALLLQKLNSLPQCTIAIVKGNVFGGRCRVGLLL